MAVSSHVTHNAGGLITCIRCWSWYNVADPYTRLFLKAQCPAIGKTGDCPVSLSLEQIHVGHCNTHPSHDLYTYRGLIYCNLCGNVVTTRMHLLNKPYERHPRSYGAINLAAIRQGKLPGQLRLASWPADLWRA